MHFFVAGIKAFVFCFDTVHIVIAVQLQCSENKRYLTHLSYLFDSKSDT